MRPPRRLPRLMLILCGALLLVVFAIVGFLAFTPQQAHVITVPTQLGAYVKEPTLDSSTALALRSKIVAGAAGEVKNVVAAVYEETTGPGTANGPQIIVFIGGNLTGAGSASGFIGGFMTQVHGSFPTTAGRLGGQAACAPGTNGGPAECAWADDDTFGVIVSATLSARGLADEMSQMRPLVEHNAR
jgi:glycerate-2-kinase